MLLVLGLGTLQAGAQHGPGSRCSLPLYSRWAHPRFPRSREPARLLCPVWSGVGVWVPDTLRPELPQRACQFRLKPEVGNRSASPMSMSWSSSLTRRLLPLLFQD